MRRALRRENAVAAVVTSVAPDDAIGSGGSADVEAWFELSATGEFDAAWDTQRGVYIPDLHLDGLSLGLRAW